MKNITRALLFILSLTILCNCSQNEEPQINEDLKTTMLEEVNKLRSEGCQCGTEYMPPVHPLRWNDTLALAAQNHAEDMHHKQYFSHISPTGTSPIMRDQQLGYTGSYSGENIAKGYSTIRQVMDAWKASESHCKAIMDSMYYEIGAAKYNTYWVQEFGKSK